MDINGTENSRPTYQKIKKHTRNRLVSDFILGYDYSGCESIKWSHYTRNFHIVSTASTKDRARQRDTSASTIRIKVPTITSSKRIERKNEVIESDVNMEKQWITYSAAHSVESSKWPRETTLLLVKMNFFLFTSFTVRKNDGFFLKSPVSSTSKIMNKIVLLTNCTSSKSDQTMSKSRPKQTIRIFKQILSKNGLLKILIVCLGIYWSLHWFVEFRHFSEFWINLEIFIIKKSIRLVFLKTTTTIVYWIGSMHWTDESLWSFDGINLMSDTWYFI